jgi:hypothetical protein
MSIFQRKLIPGNVFVDEATSGIFEYQFADTVEAGYESANTITEIHFYGHHVGLDFQQITVHVTTLCATLGFGTLSNDEKDIVGIYAATDDVSLVTHYATVHTAGDIVAANHMHAEIMGAFVGQLQKVARGRYDNDSLKSYVMEYMKDRDQIDSFMSAISTLLSYYLFKFHLGTMYGDSTDGILDYVENTGGFPLDSGLDSYEFSAIQKQIWYDANAVDPGNPTAPEQELAHDYVRDLLKDKLTYLLRDGNIT